MSKNIFYFHYCFSQKAFKLGALCGELHRQFFYITSYQGMFFQLKPQHIKIAGFNLHYKVPPTEEVMLINITPKGEYTF